MRNNRTTPKHSRTYRRKSLKSNLEYLYLLGKQITLEIVKLIKHCYSFIGQISL